MTRPSRRERCDWGSTFFGKRGPGFFKRRFHSRASGGYQTFHTVPYGTDHIIGPFPGNKLPGYDHSVPPGHLRPFAHPPFRPFADTLNRPNADTLLEPASTSCTVVRTR